MIFGCKNEFAIEADLFQGKDYVFISYCFWINNQKVGDNTQSSLLLSELDNIKHNIEALNDRNADELGKYNCQEIYDYLNYELWEIGKSNLKITTPKNINSLTVIKEYGECFDGYYCYLLSFKFYDLIIWNNSKDEVNCKKIGKNKLFNTFKEFNNWIESNTKLILSKS